MAFDYFLSLGSLDSHTKVFTNKLYACLDLLSNAPEKKGGDMVEEERQVQLKQEQQSVNNS